MGRQAVNLQQLIRSGMRVEHLKIGECIFSAAPMLVSTVLGSCVSATMHHAGTRLSGMFHAMLPLAAMQGPRALEEPCKFADSAIELLVNRFRNAGVRLSQVEVKLFGGGFTVDPERKGPIREMVDVGRKNVESARTTLARFGLKPVREHVLGDRGRKLYFHTVTGEVWMRRIEPKLTRAVRSSGGRGGL